MSESAVMPSLQPINPSGAVPLYVRIERLLRSRIADGEWQAGQQIPTEAELCEAYAVSRVTIRQSLARLTRDGLLTRGRGKGTFVREARLTAAPRGVSSFSTELTGLGMKPGSRVLGLERVRSSERVGAEMMLEPGTDLWELCRLRTADDRPIGIQTTLLIAERFPDLDRLVKPDMSLYQLLNKNFGLVPAEATEVFKVTGVPRSQAELLEVSPGSHAFQVLRVTYDARGVFEHTTSILRGDRYEIRIALHNPR